MALADTASGFNVEDLCCR